MTKLLMKLTWLLVVPFLGVTVIAQAFIGFPSYDRTTTIEPYAVFQAQPVWEPFAAYENHQVYGRVGRAVGKLEVTMEVNGIRYDRPYNCTANLIAENLIITNYHCIPANAPGLTVINAFLRMNYHSASSSGELFEVDIRPLESNANLDYVIVRVEGSPGARYGYIERRFREANPGEELFMVHHSRGEPKLITRRNCTLISRPFIANLPVQTVTGRRSFNNSTETTHRCDSLGGSSGALVFAYTDGAVVGLHFAGTEGETDPNRMANLYIRIDAIVQQSAVLHPSSPRPEPIEAQQGSLNITTNPTGARVFLNNEAVGQTPLMRNVAPGQYSVRLELDGFNPFNTSVNVTAGASAPVNAALVAVPPRQTTGTLEVRSIPAGARVFLDDRAVGNTPFNTTVNAGTYRLRVELEGYTSFVTTAQVTTGTTVPIDAQLARVAAPAAPTPAQALLPRPESSISSPVQTVEELVRRAQEGGTVRIAAGRYELREPLVLTQDVELLGAGSGQTVIRSAAGGAVLRFRGNGNFTAKGISFEYGGPRGANAVEIFGGVVEIDDCRFTGALKNLGTNEGGVGLILVGNSRGVIRNSLSTRNDFGFIVDGDAQPRLENNEARNNNVTGIQYNGRGAGVATRNLSERNGNDGINVGGSAQPLLEHNIVRHNQDFGINYWGTAGGSAANNTVENNGVDGIICQHQSQALLSSNTLRSNKRYGINAALTTSCTIGSGNMYLGNEGGGFSRQ